MDEQNNRQQNKSGGEEGNGGKGDDQQKATSSLPEKVTLGVSVLIVLGLIGFLIWHGVKSTRIPDDEAIPLVTARVQTEKAKERRGFWAIPVEIENVGNVPLEEVNVSVEMINAEGEKVTSDISFSFLAENATENAFVIIDQEPEKAKPEIAVKSFKTQRNAHGY